MTGDPSRAAVVVTGLGVVTATARSAAEFTEALRAGRSGVKPGTLFDTSPYYFHQLAQIEGFAPPEATLDRASCLVLEAARQAVADAGEPFVRESAPRVGVVIGTTCGGVTRHERILRAAAEGGRATLDEMGEVPFHALAGHVARALGAGGPVLTVTIACASGSNAVGLAADLVATGQADLVLAGGADTVSPFTFSGFSALRAMATDACAPFHPKRTGIVLGEGAGILALESAGQARRRGARAYAEVLGHGFCNDAFHSTAPDPCGGGMARSIRQALEEAGLRPDDVDYINAHGTGTQANDAMEYAAYRTVFGERIARLPLSSTKSMIGHTLGAAGAIELIACVLALQGQFLPPTVNYRTPEPAWEIDVVPNQGRPAALRRALCCNAGFAGNNTAVLVGLPAAGQGGEP